MYKYSIFIKSGENPDENELENIKEFLGDLSQFLIEHGYGSTEEDFDELNSFITGQKYDENYEAWLAQETLDAFIVIVPTVLEKEEDESYRIKWRCY